MLKSDASKIFAALFFAVIVFIVFFKKEANIKGEIIVEIHDYDLGKGVKIRLSDENCRRAFDLRDRYIRFLESTGVLEEFEIQAARNMREVFWIRWKFPERKLYDDHLNRRENQSRETTLLQCMRYEKSMRQKIEDVERRVKNITRTEIEEIFNLHRTVANYADANIKSQRMKDALGRP